MFNRFACFGHRGAAGYEPENTLLAIQKAIDLGVSWIEIDVQAVENELIVLHDFRLERTTNGKGFVWDYSLSDLRKLDAGKGQKIPLLSEVLALVKGKVRVNVELKAQGLADRVVPLVDETALISSFFHHEILRVKQINPKIPTGALIGEVPLGYCKFAEELQASAVCMSYEFLIPEMVEDAHKRGMNLFVYTVNDPKDIERVMSMGADGCFSDFPFNHDVCPL